MKTNTILAAGLACTVVVQTVLAGPIQITEWMYKGANGEFVEFTNVSGAPVDMTDWSYSDTDRQPGDLSFGSVFGVVQPGESVILTEVTVTAFRTAWGLGAGVKIFGPNTNSNLGRADEIHLYDADGVEQDFLIYDDQTGKGPRTENKSCNIPSADYGLTTASSTWTLSAVGDAFQSWKSTGGDVGSPGFVVPEPATAGFLLMGAVVTALRRRTGVRSVSEG